MKFSGHVSVPSIQHLIMLTRYSCKCCSFLASIMACPGIPLIGRPLLACLCWGLLSLPILGVCVILQNSLLNSLLKKFPEWFHLFFSFHFPMRCWWLPNMCLKFRPLFECQRHVTSCLLVTHIHLGSQTISALPNLLIPMSMIEWLYLLTEAWGIILDYSLFLKPFLLI